MESRAPAVVAVVVTTGSGPGLEATVASLAAQSYEELSLLVVANGESEHVPARVAAVAPNAFVRILEENRGFAAACNEASLMVEGSAFFLFCHDDVRLEPDAIQLMVEAAFRTNAGIVTPKVVDYEDPLVLLHVGQTCDRFGVVRERVEPGEIDHGQQDLERDVFVAPGGATLVRSDLFATLRGFDPLIPVLGEDLDLCWRAQLAGARIVVAPSAKIAHRETIIRGERKVSALGTRRASRQDLQRRHRLMVVATGWGRRYTITTLVLNAVLDVFEFFLALFGRDTDRAGAIVGSWRWLFNNRKRIFERRKLRNELRVLSDEELRRLQVGGASRLKSFFGVLLREGLESARGILPEEAQEVEEPESDGVGFAAAFSESEEFDELPSSSAFDLGRHPSKILTSFRSQAFVVSLVVVLWLLGSRNLVATHLPLIGRLAPLDSWWSTWRHFFSSWSPNGVGSGAPGMPGYGVLAFFGTFVFGRMGVLPRIALIFAVPVGAIAMSRLLKGKVSNRARLVGSISYMALPVGFNLIAQGRVDLLLVFTGLPLVVRRIFEVMNVPSFRLREYTAPIPFGHRGWRTSEAGQRMSLIMIVAFLSSIVPATLILVSLVVIGVWIARVFDPDPDHEFNTNWRFLGSLWGNVAIFLLPLSVNIAFAGRRALEVFGLVRGPWSTPHFSDLLRASDGVFGGGWSGWLLPLAGLFGVILARDVRRQIATKLATIASLTLVIAEVVAHHWTGSFAPDLDVLLTLYAVMIAGLVAVGISSLENDLRDLGFGFRQVLAAFSVVILSVSLFPFLGNFTSGRFGLPTTSIAESLSALAPASGGSYRVLWLGDPSVLPMPGWTVAPGIEAATSTNGLPGGSSLFGSPDSGATDAVLGAVREAIEGRTINLGQLLAPAGISSIVVMQTAAPVLAGVQSVPRRAVPKTLLAALSNQTDLALELQTGSVDLYANSKYYGLVSSIDASGNHTPVFSGLSESGPLTPGSRVVAGVAPASAFALNVNGQATKRFTRGSWTPTYVVPANLKSANGELVLHQFPLNGLLALFTLGMWMVVWLGFGWIQRMEWLFTGRRKKLVVARRAKVD